MTTAILRRKLPGSAGTVTRRGLKPNSQVFGQKMGLLTRLFGCWHENLSRPFTEGNTAYRSCLNCGARKQFNPDTLETYGNFYCPPAAF